MKILPVTPEHLMAKALELEMVNFTNNLESDIDFMQLYDLAKVLNQRKPDTNVSHPVTLIDRTTLILDE